MKNYFSDAELECPCCSENLMDEDFLCVLNKLRADFGYQMPVTSGYRCPEHNATIGGADDSQHLIGNAVDVYWEDYSSARKYQLIQFALDYDFRGIGISDDFIHLDRRKGKGKVWTY